MSFSCIRNGIKLKDSKNGKIKAIYCQHVDDEPICKLCYQKQNNNLDGTCKCECHYCLHCNMPKGEKCKHNKCLCPNV